MHATGNGVAKLAALFYNLDDNSMESTFDIVGSTATSVLGYLYYFSIFFFLLFLVLFFINSTIYPVFSFMDGDGGLLRVPTSNASTNTFTKAPPAWDLSGTIPDLACSGYTMTLDVLLQNSFMSTTATRPKVFLYRSPQPLPGTALTDLVDTSGSILSHFVGTEANKGDSNMILWFNAVVNDLNVSIVTGTSVAPSLKVTTIQNMPLNKPFRLGLVFTQEFLEVYINGKLEKTTVFPARAAPISVPSSSYLFGPIQTIGMGVQIGNLYYWGYPASPTQMMANATVVAGPNFFTTA